MLRYTIERLIFGIITLWLIVSVTFFLLQFLPGSPFLDDKLSAEQIAILNEKYGLNDPLPVQYARYMRNLLHGDFGKSFTFDNQDVLQDLMLPRLPRTIRVGVIALAIGMFFGMLLGSLAALNRGTIVDSFIVLLAVLGTSIPAFVFAMFLQYFIGARMQLLPVIYVDGDLSSYILPAVALSVGVISSLTRFVRTELVEVLNSDYILLARAKGLTKGQVIWRHAIRNALIPVVTIMGPIVLGIMTGSVTIEIIFSVPGIGNLLVQGIMVNDYFIILTVALFYSFLFISSILIVDLLYGIIDPRIRLAGGK